MGTVLLGQISQAIFGHGHRDMPASSGGCQGDRNEMIRQPLQSCPLYISSLAKVSFCSWFASISIGM